ncbi:hypothetical protein [Rhodopirellula sp. SWK7]|uniref:hypothetical protein n=1 Tax=Rhodopirellula sp. SWK7 TaxID=595460 RepID=UPI0002C00212|nr:hypothetical protein [Rhodopirellula sp. SWK7]EMI41224.1 hypothetical protein RRSWK_06283 [Rhodopirellula sp. SWK7]
MEGTTEPIIAVIGHPIAGNPTQFALETGFAAGQIDCRVLSVNLSPSKVAAALAGMDAMNFRAAWVSPTCWESVQNSQAIDRTATAEDSQIEPAVPPPGAVATLESVGLQAEKTSFDLVIHETSTDVSSPWRLCSMKQKVWGPLASHVLDRRESRCRNLWWIDGRSDRSSDSLTIQKEALLNQVKATKNHRWDTLNLEQIEIIRSPRQVRSENVSDDEVDIIVFSNSEDVSLSDWRLPAHSLTIDLNENWDPEYLMLWDRLKLTCSDEAVGECIRGADVHAACLSELTKTLFDRAVESDVFLEAIDEYLGV